MNDPDFCPDFRIDRNGVWYHEGTAIKRDALAKLFSDRALKIDDGGKYWLQTPYEKYPVQVEDVPYVVINYEVMDGLISFVTNMGEEVRLSAAMHWELRDGIPYIEIRNGLCARISRSVYYNLIEEFGTSIESDGRSFPLGEET